MKVDGLKKMSFGTIADLGRSGELLDITDLTKDHLKVPVLITNALMQTVAPTIEMLFSNIRQLVYTTQDHISATTSDGFTFQLPYSTEEQTLDTVEVWCCAMADSTGEAFITLARGDERFTEETPDPDTSQER